MGSVITRDERPTREIKSRSAMEKAAFNNNIIFLQQIVLKFKEETGEIQHLENSIYINLQLMHLFVIKH
jgi:hypothetical protein